MCRQTGVLDYDIIVKYSKQDRKEYMMANPNPVIRSEKQELLRQISYTRTLRDRVYRNADRRAAEYQARVDELERKLQAVEED
jgi:hypothetical protein